MKHQCGLTDAPCLFRGRTHHETRGIREKNKGNAKGITQRDKTGYLAAACRELILGGVEIPFEKGLDGHSDADVLIHAIVDAVIGALAKGDIGQLFPDNESYYEGIDSRILLRHVTKMMYENGFKLGNLDTTICAEKPKLQEYTKEMRQNIADDMHTSIANVSVKATTEEGMGISGLGDAMSAYAVVLLRS